jgi:chromosome segregation ATPase
MNEELNPAPTPPRASNPQGIIIPIVIVLFIALAAVIMWKGLQWKETIEAQKVRIDVLDVQVATLKTLNHDQETKLAENRVAIDAKDADLKRVNEKLVQTLKINEATLSEKNELADTLAKTEKTLKETNENVAQLETQNAETTKALQASEEFGKKSLAQVNEVNSRIEKQNEVIMDLNKQIEVLVIKVNTPAPEKK